MWSRIPCRAAGGALLLAAAACVPVLRGRAPAPESDRESSARGTLPAVPLVEGPLAIRVQYPSSGALIQSRDSNFIHGSVGHGRAGLTIDGRPVPVLPNGAFIGFVPNPPREAPHYELVAALGADTVRLVHPVRLLPPRVTFPASGPPIADSTSVTPHGDALALPPEERVRVSVRAAADARVWVRADTTRLQLVSGAARAGLGTDGAAAVDSIAPRYLRDPETWAADVPARVLQRGARLVVARGADTVRFPLPIVEVVDAAPRWALLGAAPVAAGDTDRVVVGRAIPAGGYSWFLLPGTAAEVTGRSGAFTRIRLDSQLEIWVGNEEVQLLPAGYAAPRRTISTMSLVPAAEWVDVVIPTGERPPYLVEERERTLVLTLYGTSISPGLVRYLENDSLVRHIVWEQETSDRARLSLHLSERPFGYLAMWDEGRFTLRVRRTPPVARRHPLRGLTIVVDAGHPPAGATGPTGLYEGEAVLPVALRVRELLEERGATVVMTRTTPDPVALGDRPVAARRANAHALVSVHLNALPDGVNPFRANGASVLYFHPHSEPLAREIQRELVRRLGLRDLGVHFQNIALGRPTWMPAVLTEGLFIMMPEQEAAMRSPEGREAYARAIADGLEAYFRALGEESR